jgi:hypothetical protein
MVMRACCKDLGLQLGGIVDHPHFKRAVVALQSNCDTLVQ